jgi:hypothetical protein
VTQKTRDYFKELDRQAKAGLAKDASSEAADAAAVSAFPPNSLHAYCFCYLSFSL